MDFKILGPVSAGLDGHAVALDGSKQRTTLAALLLADGKVMPDERLTAILWGWEPPATSTRQLYTYVSRLRTRLGTGVRLERQGPGYRMDIGDASLDWSGFRGLAGTGRADLLARRYEEAERRLAQALALWHGPALTGVTEHLRDAEGPLMEEARLTALEDHAEAALALGRHTDMVPALTRQVTRQPVRERLRGQLMTALFRSGRQADALAVYEEGRRALADELGIDPGPSLRALHQEVLTGTLAPPAAPERRTVTLPAPPASPGPPTAPAGRRTATEGTAAPEPERTPHPDGAGRGVPIPATLPASPADFTGRVTETEEVVTALRGPHDVVITGASGTGKSALALRAADRCRDDFPQGRLYADLRTAEGGPRAPAEVLGWFLHALGVEPDRTPAALDERIQLYRTLLAGRRMLVVLDNASDDAQVRPLLPGGGACRTVVTGVRSHLASLEGTRLVRLGPLPPADAGRLLAAVAGPGRFTASPEAAARIAESCDRLPLALRIAAARLAAHPHWPAELLADRLARPERRLAELRLGSLDIRTGLRSVVDGLDPATGAALRVLAAADLSRLTAGDAAALLDTGPDAAEELLERLVDSQLLEAWSIDGDARLCYRFLPLVQLFARAGHAPQLVAP
ncbi:transcriptional regulator [Streptomyces peucetius]|uniref:Transcriptional regulator n=1 Tax=Streptomyces peucetius TaxID=1950 RepID=A0ABY6IG74_STRPE|nr:transcriptional regulator [Streptomyces peucetius]UYQ64847.1 transcriptional regulator [Streptomyces peucetius]